jgi:hypothetical protein
MEWVKGGAKMEKMHTSKLLALVAGRRGITFTLLVIHSCIMYVNDTAETHADMTKQVSIVPGSLPGMHSYEHVPAPENEQMAPQDACPQHVSRKVRS